MTAQINDTFRYKNKHYSIAGISEGELFEPSQLGMKPSWCSTACWRGYHALYALADKQLVLDALDVNLLGPGEDYERLEGPPINGVLPTESEEDMDRFNNHYEQLNYALAYTGGVLLADGFIKDLYVHMGFQPAWKYKRVVELTFDKGILTGEFDRSSLMAEVRKKFLTDRHKTDTDRMPTQEEIAEFVERAFDRRYRH